MPMKERAIRIARLGRLREDWAKFDAERARGIGHDAGKASKQGDRAREIFHRDYFQRYRNTLHPDDRRKAEDAYVAGYSVGHGG